MPGDLVNPPKNGRSLHVDVLIYIYIVVGLFFTVVAVLCTFQVSLGAGLLLGDCF